MAKITAAMVKELREMTGAGMMECKKALVEAEADMEKAVDVLRTAGLAAVAKKAGRATNEGAIVALVSEDATEACLLELNCETDFVAMNEKFGAYGDKIAHAILENKPADIDALKAAAYEGETVEAILTDAIHTLGENINLPRFVFVEQENGAVASYIHGAGKIGALVQFELGNREVIKEDAFKAYAHDVAMQVAAVAPIAPNREAVSADVIEHEMNIYKAQAAESGKPENIQEKIATGRMEKFFKETVLTEQVFVKDADKTINDYTAETAKALGTEIKVANFVRFALGE